MTTVESLLTTMEAELRRSPALERCLKLGICYGLLQQTVAAYTLGDPATVNQTTLALLNTLIQTKALDTILFGRDKRAVEEQREEALTLEPTLSGRVESETTAHSQDFDAGMIRRFLKFQGMADQEVEALLRIYGGQMTVSDDPDTEVQSNTDEDQARREAADLNPLYGVAGFSDDPPGNFTTNGDGGVSR